VNRSAPAPSVEQRPVDGQAIASFDAASRGYPWSMRSILKLSPKYFLFSEIQLLDPTAQKKENELTLITNIG